MFPRQPPQAGRLGRALWAGCTAVLACAGLAGCVRAPGAPVAWRALEPGLEFAQCRLPGGRQGSADSVVLLRMDPREFELRLLSAREINGRTALTAAEWIRLTGALAVTNASMYMTDGHTSVFLMRSAGHVNNPTLGRAKAVFLTQPLDSAFPSARIAETDDPGFPMLLPRYRTAVQDIRIVASKPRPHVVWKGSGRRWSEAAVGQDGRGRMLFAFSSGAVDPGDFGAGLLELGLDLRVLMHTEGGDKAVLQVNAPALRAAWAGQAEGPLDPDAGSDEAPGIPNVLAVVRRTAGPAASPGAARPAGGGAAPQRRVTTR